MSGRAQEQHLRDLPVLRRVRDRIDRKYAQPLDVEALARAAHMSAGLPPCVAKQATRPLRNRAAPVNFAHLVQELR